MELVKIMTPLGTGVKVAELAIDVEISNLSISVDAAQKEVGTPIQQDVLKFQTQPQTTQKFLEQLKFSFFL